MTFVLLNGALLQAAEARISPEDRGFRFGDGVFETIRVLHGRPYLWEYHKERLEAGLEALQIEVSAALMLPQIDALLQANQVEEGILRIVISRGVGSEGYLPLKTIPTVYLTTQKEALPPLKEKTLCLSRYVRPAGKSLPSQVKHASALVSVLARMEAAAARADDAILLSFTGHLSETSSANLFWQTGEMIFTPTLSTDCLPGTMRRRCLELFPGVEEVEAPLEQLLEADAVWLTNARMLVMPVSGITTHNADTGSFFSIPSSWAVALRWRERILKDMETSG